MNIKKRKLLILGIETSCDETAAAVLEVESPAGGRIPPVGGMVARGNQKSKAESQRFKVRSNVVLSQIATHRRFGGVVPEVAARKHTENILSVVDRALVKAKVKISSIDRLAVTYGPGLITSLMVGVETAKNLSYINKIPLVGVNHLEGHLLSWQACEPASCRAVEFPAIGLIVSGGHTELILIKGISKYQKVGQTLDDAAGECFDKVAKILDLGYPGGSAVSQKARNGKLGRFNLPSPMLKSDDLNFSFAGLKTSVLYYVQKNGRPQHQALNDFCASVEDAIVKVLVAKTIKAAKVYQAKTIIVGGGVAANQRLRAELQKSLNGKCEGWGTGKSDLRFKNYELRISDLEYCGDNAVMIALAGYYTKPIKDGWKNLAVEPNLEIGV